MTGGDVIGSNNVLWFIVLDLPEILNGIFIVSIEDIREASIKLMNPNN
jgi:hypothetical protein